MVVTSNINEHAFNIDDSCQRLYTYQEYFENQFLEETGEFYRSEALAYLQEHSVVGYLSKVCLNLVVNHKTTVI